MKLNNEEIINMYVIVEKDNTIEVHEPSYIKIKNPCITYTKDVCVIENDKACVTLWFDIKRMHITLYD